MSSIMKPNNPNGRIFQAQSVVHKNLSNISKSQNIREQI